jgi:hypothetical protein
MSRLVTLAKICAQNVLLHQQIVLSALLGRAMLLSQLMYALAKTDIIKMRELVMYATHYAHRVKDLILTVAYAQIHQEMDMLLSVITYAHAAQGISITALTNPVINAIHYA